MKPVYKKQIIQQQRRDYWVNGMSIESLAKAYKVSRSTMWRILNYKVWLSVPDIFTEDDITRHRRAS